jgi:hypothetical protein
MAKDKCTRVSVDVPDPLIASARRFVEKQKTSHLAGKGGTTTTLAAFYVEAIRNELARVAEPVRLEEPAKPNPSAWEAANDAASGGTEDRVRAIG